MNVYRTIDDPTRLDVTELEYYVISMYEHTKDKHVIDQLMSVKDGISYSEYQENLIQLYNLKRMDDKNKATEFKIKIKELEFKNKLKDENVMSALNVQPPTVLNYNSLKENQLLNGGEEVIFLLLKTPFNLSEENYDSVMKVVRENQDFNLASIISGYNHEATRLAVETSYIHNGKLQPAGTDGLIEKFVMYESIVNGKDANELRRNIDNRILDNSDRL